MKIKFHDDGEELNIDIPYWVTKIDIFMEERPELGCKREFISFERKAHSIIFGSWIKKEDTMLVKTDTEEAQK